MREITVSRGEASRRLDKYLMKYMNAAPPGFIYKMLRKKRIKLNNARADGNEILREGDVITMYLSDETAGGFMSERVAPVSAGGLDIIFEDSDIMFVNKPAGMLVHGGPSADTDNLASRLAYYLKSKDLLSSTFTPAPSNRLDRNTSGIVACGKNPAAVRALNEAQSEKHYMTAVSGRLRTSKRITGHIYKNAANNESIVGDDPFAGTKEIITEYEPIGWGNDVTLLRVKLITGRSHQIRAQLKAAGLPVIGDPKYGDPCVNKRFHLKYQLLHAVSYTFLDNSGLLEKYNHMTFWAPVPVCFASFINNNIGELTDESDNISRGLRYKALPPYLGQAEGAFKNPGKGNY